MRYLSDRQVCAERAVTEFGQGVQERGHPRTLISSLCNLGINTSAHAQVSHAIIDGMILTERWKVHFGEEWYAEKTADEKNRIHPASIARVSDKPGLSVRV